MSNYTYDFTKFKEFRFWCNKVLPLTYDDSLSYYEVLCKTVNILNNALGTLNDVTDAVDELAAAVNAFDDRYDALEQGFADLTAYVQQMDATFTDRINDQDRKLTIAIDNMNRTIDQKISALTIQLTHAINDELKTFKIVVNKQIDGVYDWVRQTMDEFREEIPEFENVYVIDPVTGELVNIQVALNHIYDDNSYGGMHVFEWIRANKSINELNDLMIWSIPRGMTCREIAKESRLHLWSKVDPATHMPSFLTGKMVSNQENININNMILAAAGSMEVGQLDTLNLTVDEIASKNITCYNFNWHSNTAFA